MAEPDEPPKRDHRPEPVTDEDAAIIEDPAEHFDLDAPPEELDRQQAEQAEVVERDKDWIDPRERIGGD